MDDDDDLDALMAKAGIDHPYDHYDYEDEQALEPYDGIEDFEDHLSPTTVVCLWAIAAIVIGVILLL